MIVIDTKIVGCKYIDQKIFDDHRGSFYESYHLNEFEKYGLPTKYKQDNTSISHANVLRGLHIQKVNPQGKLVSCMSGKIFDVCVDLRPDSHTFKKWIGVWLVRGKSLYLPEGCAHGFFAEIDSIVNYKCTTLWHKESDGGINPFDNLLAINWPKAEDYIMSKKDKILPSLKEYTRGWNVN